MGRRLCQTMALVAGLWAPALVAPVGAETLSLNERLVALQSPEGGELLFQSEANDDYGPLSIHFVTQQHPAFCGPASIAMVLNALEVPRPASDMTLGLGMFDQDNIFNAAANAAKPREEILKGGMTLDELGAVFAAYGLSVDVRHAEDSSLEAFRDITVAELEAPDGFVLVNYLRSAIGQETGGHISPIAAYDADTDRILIMDVSRYKYPPVWVEAAALFDAMNTPDSDNDDRSRGYAVVRR